MNHIPPSLVKLWFSSLWILQGEKWLAKKKGAAKGRTEGDPNEMRTKWRTRSESPLAERNILNNPSETQLSEKIWQLWDIQWKQWPQSAYARQYLKASEVLSPS